EFRAAHGAKLGFLVVVVGQGFVMHGAGGFGIKREFELFLPIEGVAGVTQSVVAIASAGTVASNVGRMGGNLVGDDAVFYVFLVRKSQMLFGCDITKHGGAVPADESCADGRSNVIVSGGDVCDQRSQGVKRSTVTPLHFLIHLLFDLVQ